MEECGWIKNRGEANVKYHEVWFDCCDVVFGDMFKVFTGEVYLVVDMQYVYLYDMAKF